MNPGNSSDEIVALLNDTSKLKSHITKSLYEYDQNHPVIQHPISNSGKASAVLFLLGMRTRRKDGTPEPCLILNKRSSKVKQAGDLCCPGGGISFFKDTQLARLLMLPGSPLTRWKYWKRWKKQNYKATRPAALLLAASLRECYEEMQLNPLKVSFMGVLPIQQLGTFGREIYPMVGWVSQQKRFVLNWEVDKIIKIPIRHLMNPDHYARTRFSMHHIPEETNHLNYNDRPCLIHKDGDETEILWGATFRITTFFLDIVFGFTPPPIQSLPVVQSKLDKNYLSGSRPND